jgi:3-hydroxyacyl-[acyl-carrier-protein] dehydratase
MLVDLSQIDLSKVEDNIEGIRKYNRQRYEMEMLTAVVKFDKEGGYVVAYKDAAPEEFWIRGHIPGRPLMPGVLICECAAQACSYFYGRGSGQDRFLGFAGMEGVKFRGQVLPGDRLVMVAKMREMKSRLSTFDCQGFVKGQMVFEGTITGVAL